jgi:hypothetical protein
LRLDKPGHRDRLLSWGRNSTFLAISIKHNCAAHPWISCSLLATSISHSLDPSKKANSYVYFSAIATARILSSVLLHVLQPTVCFRIDRGCIRFTDRESTRPTHISSHVAGQPAITRAVSGLESDPSCSSDRNNRTAGHIRSVRPRDACHCDCYLKRFPAGNRSIRPLSSEQSVPQVSPDLCRTIEAQR